MTAWAKTEKEEEVARRKAERPALSRFYIIRTHLNGAGDIFPQPRFAYHCKTSDC